MSSKDGHLDTLRRELLDAAAEIEAPCEPSRYSVLRRIVANPDNYVTLGFGAGSMPAVAGNCALYSILEDLDVRAHVREVWGVSAGSIVGACYSTETPPEIILELAQAIDPRKVVDIPIWDVCVKGMIDFLRHRRLPDGFMRGDRFMEQVAAGLRETTFERCRIPFHAITCTDDGYARKVILRQGSLLQAIRASMCIPGVMLPVSSDDGEHGYLDGAVVEKTPLRSIIEQHARSDRGEQLVVIATHFDDSGYVSKPEGFMGRFASTIARLEDMVWAGQLADAVSGSNRKLVMLNARLEFPGMFDIEAIRFNYLLSRRRFKEQLSNAGLAARFTAS